MEPTQVHIGVNARDDACLAKLPDGVLTLPVDLGLFVSVAPDVQAVLVEVRREVPVIKTHRAVNHGLHAIVMLDERAELLELLLTPRDVLLLELLLTLRDELLLELLTVRDGPLVELLTLR